MQPLDEAVIGLLRKYYDTLCDMAIGDKTMSV